MSNNNLQGTWLPHVIIHLIQRSSWLLLVLILVFGWTSPWLMLLTFICMIGPIVFSFYYGRAWCGNFCPRWSFSKVILSVISPNKPFPNIFKNNLFRILMLLLLMMFFTYNLIQSNGTLFGVGIALIKMMAITAFIQICLAIVIHPYAWCSICPMGTVSFYIARIRSGKLDNIKIDKKCISCGVCSESCPMQIDIPSWAATGELKDADCMKCRECIKNCSNKCLDYN